MVWSHHPFISPLCLLSTCCVSSALDTQRCTQPQPALQELTVLPAGPREEVDRTPWWALTHPVVLTVAPSVTPTASPHPAIKISAKVIMDLVILSPSISSVLLPLVHWSFAQAVDLDAGEMTPTLPRMPSESS